MLLTPPRQTVEQVVGIAEQGSIPLVVVDAKTLAGVGYKQQVSERPSSVTPHEDGQAGVVVNLEMHVVVQEEAAAEAVVEVSNTEVGVEAQPLALGNRRWGP